VCRWESRLDGDRLHRQRAKVLDQLGWVAMVRTRRCRTDGAPLTQRITRHTCGYEMPGVLEVRPLRSDERGSRIQRVFFRDVRVAG